MDPNPAALMPYPGSELEVFPGGFRLYADHDLPTLNRWRDEHDAPPLPKEAIPALGAVVLDEAGDPGAMLFLFEPNSTGLCWVEFAATRPGLKPKEAFRFFEVGMSFLQEQALEHDFTGLQIVCSEVLARSAERMGFERTEDDLVHLMKRADDGL